MSTAAGSFIQLRYVHLPKNTPLASLPGSPPAQTTLPETRIATASSANLPNNFVSAFILEVSIMIEQNFCIQFLALYNCLHPERRRCKAARVVGRLSR